MQEIEYGVSRIVVILGSFMEIVMCRGTWDSDV